MEILVIEDEVRLAQHISRALTEVGHEPVMVHDGETALAKADLKRYDLIVLDVMLPGMDGLEVLRRLRATKIDTRVLILTARGEVSDRVTGLGLGADDFLAKPFAMQELVARVSALGRRFPEEAPIKLQIADQVQNQISNLELDRRFLGKTSAERTHSRDQFLHCEGLREVIVRPQSEAGHSIADLT